MDENHAQRIDSLTSKRAEECARKLRNDADCALRKLRLQRNTREAQEAFQAAHGARALADTAMNAFITDHPIQGLAALERAQRYWGRLSVPVARRGRPFVESKRGLAARTHIMREALAALPAGAPPLEILAKIEELDPNNEILDEVDQDDCDGVKIYWRGRQKPMPFKTFRNRISEMRKKR